MNFLRIVKHPNLVNLVGYCAEDDERGIQRLLVYELMPNRSLEDHLLGRIASKLSWPLRLKIALDAAHGLAFLHEEMDFQVFIGSSYGFFLLWLVICVFLSVCLIFLNFF